MEKKPKCQQLHAHAFKAQKSLRHEGTIQIQTQNLIYKLKPPQHSTSWFWGWLLDQSLQLFSFFQYWGGAKKLSILIIAAKGPRQNHRGASSTAEETTGEEAEDNQRQIELFEKAAKTRKFMKSCFFCLTGNELGFLQGTSDQSCHLVLKYQVWGTHPRMATGAPVWEGSFPAAGKGQSSYSDG